MSDLATKQAEAFIKSWEPDFAGRLRLPFYAGVKKIQRSYGGPEEGGWYYNSSVEYVNPRLIRNREEFAEYVRGVFEEFNLRWYGDAERHPARWDNGDGYTLCFRWDSPFPDPKTYPRPQYE